MRRVPTSTIGLGDYGKNRRNHARGDEGVVTDRAQRRARCARRACAPRARATCQGDAFPLAIAGDRLRGPRRGVDRVQELPQVRSAQQLSPSTTAAVTKGKSVSGRGLGCQGGGPVAVSVTAPGPAALMVALTHAPFASCSAGHAHTPALLQPARPPTGPKLKGLVSSDRPALETSLSVIVIEGTGEPEATCDLNVGDFHAMGFLYTRASAAHRADRLTADHTHTGRALPMQPRMCLMCERVYCVGGHCMHCRALPCGEATSLGAPVKSTQQAAHPHLRNRLSLVCLPPLPSR